MEVLLQDKETELIAKSSQLLMQYGIKSMTMDDISRQLGISKKTLYLHVKDKNDLVNKVMDLIISGEQNEVTKLCDLNPNAIDMVFELTRAMSVKFGQTHPSIHYDLQKYHPQAWELFVDFKENFVANCMLENLKKGIEQGLYRDNIDPYIISRVYTAKIEFCFDGQTFAPSEYDFAKIHREMMRYHIRGIASDKGLQYLKEKVQRENFDL